MLLSYSPLSAPSRLITSANARRRRPDRRARARRRRDGLRHPRGCLPADLRRPPRQPDPPRPDAPRGGRRARRRGLCASVGRGSASRIGTSGPGATNLVTAIADAEMDSVPTLFITGQVKTALRGTNAFQEADVIGITQPIVKHSIAVERRRRLRAGGRRRAADRHQRPPRAGADRRPQRHRDRPRRGTTSHPPYLPGYRPRERPERAPGPARGGGARGRAAAGALRRRRRGQRRRVGGAAGARRRCRARR